jgi:Tol biopolymer transport system component
MPILTWFLRARSAPLALAAALLLAPHASAQEALRAEIQWSVLSSGDFEIHYPGPEFLPRAREVAAWLVAAQVRIEKDLDHDIEGKVSVILYRSRLEAGQHEAGEENPGLLFPLLTELRKRRIVIPLVPSNRSMQRTIEFQLAQVAIQQRHFGRTSLVASLFEYKSIFYPVWVTRGIAVSQAGPIESVEEMLVRDAVLDGALPALSALHSFDHLNRHFRYSLLAESALAVRWISEATPRGSAKRLMHVFDSDLPFPPARHVKRACGMSYSQVEREFAHAMEERYRPWASKEEAETFSRRLGPRDQYYRYYELGATLSPDGTKVAYLEDSAGYFDLAVVDLETMTESHPLKLDLHVTLDEVRARFRGLDWSPDGGSICFVGDRLAAPQICIWSFSEGLRAVRLPFDDLASPQWSPDGRTVAFVGQLYGYADIYLLDVATSAVRRVSHGAAPEVEPTWSPDGKWIAFAVETEGQYDLWRIAPDGTGLERLTRTPHDEITPAWRPDGAALSFAADPDGVHNLYSLTLADGSLVRHTDVPGGAFAPRWSADGSEITFTLYRHGRFQARGMPPRVAAAPPPPPDPARETLARHFTVGVVESWSIRPYETRIRFESILPTSAALSDILGRHRFDVDFDYRLRSNGYDLGVEVEYVNRALRPDLFIKTSARIEKEGGENETRYGAELGIVYPVEAFTRVSGSWFIEAIDRRGLDEDDPDPEGTTVEAGLRLNAARRYVTKRRNNPIGGYVVTGGLTWMTHWLGSDIERTTYNLEGRLYAELLHDVVLAARLGAIHSTGPDAEQLSLKDRVRAYGSSEPRGPDLAFLNVELRFPLYRDLEWVLPGQIALLKDVRASVFGDVGVISNEENALNMLVYPVRDEWHYSAGAALQLDFYILERQYLPVIFTVSKALDGTDEAPSGLNFEVVFELAF